MARTDTLGHFLTDVADAIREKTGNTEPIIASEIDTEIASIQGGGYDGTTPRNSYISARGISSSQIEVTLTDVDELTDGTRVYYSARNVPDLPSENYIEIAHPDTTGIINNLTGDTSYGLRTSSYVEYDTDKKAYTTTKDSMGIQYAITLPSPGGITNKFTIVAPDEIINNSYTWNLEYDPYDDKLYLYSNGNLLYQLKSDYTWEQLTLPDDAEVVTAIATPMGLFIGSQLHTATTKLYKYKNGTFTNCNIPSYCMDIRRLSCGIYLFLGYSTSRGTLSHYRFDEDEDAFIQIIRANNNDITRFVVSDYGEDVYLRGYYTINYIYPDVAWYFNTTTKTIVLLNGGTYRFDNLDRVITIGDGLYVTTMRSTSGSTGYIAILENKTSIKYTLDSSAELVNAIQNNRIFINPFKTEDIICLGSNSSGFNSYILNKNTGTKTSDQQWYRAQLYSSLVYNNKLLIWDVAYSATAYTDYCGQYVRLYDEDGFYKSLQVGGSSYRPHMWVDDDGNLYRLDLYFRKYDTTTDTFTLIGGYPDGSGSKSYRCAQVENRRYFSQANSTTGPLLYIKNGVITKLGTGRYHYAVKIDDTHDLLISTDSSVTQKLVDHVNLTVEDTGMPGCPQFFNNYYVDNTNHKIYKDGETDLEISENYTFTPTTPSTIQDTMIRNRYNNFDYMYYTDATTNTALVYTEPHAKE